MTLKEIFDYIHDNTTVYQNVKRNGSRTLSNVRRASHIYKAARECIAVYELNTAGTMSNEALSILTVGDLYNQGALRVANDNEYR